LDPARGEDRQPSLGGGRSRVEDLNARREEAWWAGRIDRERPFSLAAVALGAVLVMAWGLADYLLEPRWFELFLSLRLGATALLVPLGFVVWRTRNITWLRLATVAAMVTLGVAVAIMLPRLGPAFALYVLGYSLLFWGSAVVLFWPPWCAALAYGSVMAAYAIAHLTHDGSRTAAEIGGATFYLLSTAIIVTTLSFFKFRLERRTFELAFSLEERNEELRHALERLGAAQARLVETEKQSALGRLLAALSHELNNPVNVIANNVEPVRTYVDLLARVASECAALRRSNPDVDRALAAIASEEELDFVVGDVRAAIDTIEAGSNRMRHVHADLRAFIRGDGSQAVTGDPTPGLRATVDMLRRGLRKSVEIDARYADLPPVRHEPGPLNQVFLNLIQNAIDSVGESGKVEVASRVADGSVEVVVSDSGPGVSERARAHLFEPFFTTKPVGQGTGLGLAISKQIVERQGGQIELADPQTATFVVRLPIPPPHRSG
jgi:signal transduction histidine kinase